MTIKRRGLVKTSTRAFYKEGKKADKSRLIFPEEAIGILEAKNELGHVSRAYFKNAML